MLIIGGISGSRRTYVIGRPIDMKFLTGEELYSAQSEELGYISYDFYNEVV